MRIDMHTHIFPESLPPFAQRFGDPRFPSLEKEGNMGKVICENSVYRRIPECSWNVKSRLEDMDKEDVAIHVLSPTPILLGYWQPVEAAVEFCRYVNDYIAGMVKQDPKRFIGLGMVPLQDTDAAIAEMNRGRKELGLAGFELGASVNGKFFSAPEMRPFFKAAADSDTPLFIHPLNERWSQEERIQRAKLAGLHGGINMPGETGLAAASLILSGIMSDLPHLNVLLAHGGGTFAMVVPRLSHVWEGNAELRKAAKTSPIEQSRSFWVDALTQDIDCTLLCKKRFGADKLVLGTDYPFDGRREKPPGSSIDEAAKSGLFTAAEVEDIHSNNALRFLKQK